MAIKRRKSKKAPRKKGAFGKKVKKITMKIGKTVKNITVTSAIAPVIAPLLPFFPLFKKTLQAKGITPPKAPLELIKSFYTNIVKKSSLEGTLPELPPNLEELLEYAQKKRMQRKAKKLTKKTAKTRKIETEEIPEPEPISDTTGIDLPESSDLPEGETLEENVIGTVVATMVKAIIEFIHNMKKKKQSGQKLSPTEEMIVKENDKIPDNTEISVSKSKDADGTENTTTDLKTGDTTGDESKESFFSKNKKFIIIGAVGLVVIFIAFKFLKKK